MHAGQGWPLPARWLKDTIVRFNSDRRLCSACR